MHPAPSLAQAPPKTDGSRSPSHGFGPAGGPQQQHHHHSPPTPSQSVSPPLRKDTPSSLANNQQHSPATSPAAGNARLSVDPAGNSSSYGAETSPNLHQSIFSVTDGSDLSNHRRATRRRTGPLSQQQREKAALIRKLGACPDCRRRRVAVSEKLGHEPRCAALTPYRISPRRLLRYACLCAKTLFLRGSG